MKAILNLLGIIDRALFFIGILLIVVKLFGWIAWPWKWVLAPLLLFVIITFIKRRLIRKQLGL